MSVAALLYRLRDLGVISERYSQEWWRFIGSTGWKREEPHETPPEEPQWLTQSTLRASRRRRRPLHSLVIELAAAFTRS